MCKDEPLNLYLLVNNLNHQINFNLHNGVIITLLIIIECCHHSVADKILDFLFFSWETLSLIRLFCISNEKPEPRYESLHQNLLKKFKHKIRIFEKWFKLFELKRSLLILISVILNLNVNLVDTYSVLQIIMVFFLKAIIETEIDS